MRYFIKRFYFEYTIYEISHITYIKFLILLVLSIFIKNYRGFKVFLGLLQLLISLYTVHTVLIYLNGKWEISYLMMLSYSMFLWCSCTMACWSFILEVETSSQIINISKRPSCMCLQTWLSIWVLHQPDASYTVMLIILPETVLCLSHQPWVICQITWPSRCAVRTFCLFIKHRWLVYSAYLSNNSYSNYSILINSHDKIPFWRFRNMAWDRPGNFSVIPVFCIIILAVDTVVVVVIIIIIITAPWIKLTPINGSQGAGFNSLTKQPVRRSIMATFIQVWWDFVFLFLLIMFIEFCMKNFKACNRGFNSGSTELSLYLRQFQVAVAQTFARR